MLEHCITATPDTRIVAYLGPERRRQSTAESMTRWLAHMLDETDHGMLLVSPDGTLHHANQPARLEFIRGDTLQLVGSHVNAARREQQGSLLGALADAGHGRRRLLMLGAGRVLPVAAVPLSEGTRETDAMALLVLGKRRNCPGLSVDFFAHTHGLTCAEARVLQALCGGLRPKEVARQFEVAVSTVRTQITNIRHKTQTSSIRDLVERVSTLPPIASRVRSAVLS
ncbi:helix-turn-helix transcriptional regulator [Rhizobacter sp. J219]|uniref:helix-turn-helix transcriptional regulator n=1 Tax=Rhizobacter sp. J219 TaxID=2898430 RepID=UPI0021509CC6|nr:helix-turn-helix transcriptional regulator [Rhizobacter sp. J219]MCR5884695.1 helix-turn-helix transcriptional regulator [Rhizobacter sp. J219]